MQKKPWYKSRTFWFNVATLGAYSAKQYFGVTELPDPDPVLIAVANIVLRLVTKQSIGLRAD